MFHISCALSGDEAEADTPEGALAAAAALAAEAHPPTGNPATDAIRAGVARYSIRIERGAELDPALTYLARTGVRKAALLERVPEVRA